MIVIPDRNHTIFYDVDDTLVEWVTCTSEAADHPSVINGLQPHSSYLHVPHEWHINALKDAKRAGATIVVWSQGGSLWAEQVVKALGLEEFVDVCLNKPTMHYDDLPSKVWMGQWKYLGRYSNS